MTWLRMAMAVLALAVIGGCGTLPQPNYADDDEPVLLIPPPPAPLVEYPPVDPVEPPMPAPEDAASSPTEPLPTPTATPPTTPAPPPAPEPAPAERSEEALAMGVIADLQRYGNQGADDLKKELVTATQALTRQRTDANRIRLAVVYTLVRTGPQDDQRAAQLLETVVKGSAPNGAMQRQLAAVLLAQVNERLKAVRDEQQKANDALQKLEALRQLERGMLRDRVRSGGGGGGGGGGGSSGGGGG